MRFLYIMKNLIYYLWNVGLCRLIEVYEEQDALKIKCEDMESEIENMKWSALGVKNTLEREIQEKDIHIEQLQVSVYWHMENCERKMKNKNLEIEELQKKVIVLQETLTRKLKEADVTMQEKNSTICKFEELISIHEQNVLSVSKARDEAFEEIENMGKWFAKTNERQQKFFDEKNAELKMYEEQLLKIAEERRLYEEQILEIGKERELYKEELLKIRKQRAEETLQHFHNRFQYNYGCKMIRRNLDVLFKCINNCKKHFKITDDEIDKAITRRNSERYILRTIFADPIHLNPWLYRRFVPFDLYGITNTSLYTLIKETEHCILTFPGPRYEVRDDEVNMEEIGRIRDEMNPNWFKSKKTSISEQLQIDTTNTSDSEDDLEFSESDDDLSTSEDNLLVSETTSANFEQQSSPSEVPLIVTRSDYVSQDSEDNMIISKAEPHNSEQLQIETTNSSDSEDALVISKSADVSPTSDGFQTDLEDLGTCENYKRDFLEEDVLQNNASPKKDNREIQESLSSDVEIQKIVEAPAPAKIEFPSTSSTFDNEFPTSEMSLKQPKKRSQKLPRFSKSRSDEQPLYYVSMLG